MANPVEDYLNLVGLEYREVGSCNLQLTMCPFCGVSDESFFINADPEATDNEGRKKMWSFKCHRENHCGQKAGGGYGEYILKKTVNAKFDRNDPLPRKGDDSTVGATAPSGVTTSKKKQYRDPLPNVDECHDWLVGDPAMLQELTDEKRGWSESAIRRMKIGVINHKVKDAKYSDGTKVKDEIQPCILYPYFENGVLVDYKCRTFDRFIDQATGEWVEVPRGFAKPAGYDQHLFNYDAIHEDMDYLVLVEGEGDTMSVLTLGEEKVVGVPGAGNHGSGVAKWAMELQKVKKKYLLFDPDKAGQDGARKFAERFGIDGFYNVVIPSIELPEPITEEGETRTHTKDIGEYIRYSGCTLAEFRGLLSKYGKKFGLDGVSSAEDVAEELIEEIRTTDDFLPPYSAPWADMNRIFAGARPGQFIIIVAPPKSGKTTLVLEWLKYLSYDLAKGNSHFECLEMTDRELLRKLAANMTDTADHAEDNEEHKRLTRDEVIAMLSNFRDKVAAYAHNFAVKFGYTSASDTPELDGQIKRLKNIIMTYDIKVWAFDNLQLFVDRTWDSQKHGGRHQYISKCTKAFKDLAMSTKTLGILISQPKDTGEDGIATTQSSEGSRSPNADCDFMIVVNRVKGRGSNATKASDLIALGDASTVASFLPQVYVNVGLTRHGPGGTCVLWSEMEKSRIRDMSPAERESLKKAASKGKDEDSGNLKTVSFNKAKAPGPPPDFNIATEVGNGVPAEFASDFSTEAVLDQSPEM